MPKCKETLAAFFNVSIRIIELAIFIKSNNFEDLEYLFFNTISINTCFYKHFMSIQLSISEDNHDLLTIEKNSKNKNKVTVFIGEYGNYVPSSIPKMQMKYELESELFWFSKYFKLDDFQIKEVFEGNGSRNSGSVYSGRKGQKNSHKSFYKHTFIDELIFSNINFKDIKNHEERIELLQKDNQIPSIIFQDENTILDKNTSFQNTSFQNTSFQNTLSKYKQHLINKAVSNSITKNEMFLSSKAPNIKLFSKLVLEILKDNENYYSSLILISIFTSISIKELLYVFTEISSEIKYLSSYGIFRIKINSTLFANATLRNHEITKRVRNDDLNIFLPDFLQKLSSFAKGQAKKIIIESTIDNKFNQEIYNDVINQELKNISKVLLKHKKSLRKNISHVNIKSIHRLFFHCFHILNEKTDTSILLLHNLSKNNQARICYTVRPKRLINYENWMMEFYNILTNKYANSETYDSTKNQFIGSPMFVEDHVFKNFLLGLFEIKANTRIEIFNLQMIFLRYSLSILLATRSSSGACNLLSYSKNLSLLTIHEKAKSIKSSKRLIPLTSRAIEYIELFYELRKEFNFDGFIPILLENKENKLISIELNKNSVLEFLETICDKQLFVSLKKFIKSTELNFGRHVFSTKSIHNSFNREFENEFMGHYSKGKLGLGIYSNFDIQKYITSTKEFMKRIEDDYFPTYIDPRNFK